MKVFVTGASSCLSRAVLPLLCEAPEVETVFGVDLKPAWFRHSKFDSAIFDTRSRELESQLVGFDAVVHLAYAVMQGPLSPAELYDNNVKGSLNVFVAASKLGIKKIINMSSASVYGAGDDISEAAPLNPSPKFLYATHKAIIEEQAGALWPSICHLRSHLIFGRNAQRFLHEMANAPVVIKPRNPQPLIQVIHEQDVAWAILQALRRAEPPRGAFNLAASQKVSLVELIRYGRRFVFPMPLGVARAMVNSIARLGRRSETTWLEVLDTALTLDCSKAARELGWRPRFTPWQARAEMTRSI